jgi:hypothetical protein
MGKRLVMVGVVMSVGLLVIATGSALAAPSGTGQCHQDVNSTLVGVSEEGTRGDFQSDGFYGNEPNIVDPFAPGGPGEQEPGTQAGRVVPSQSPGPFVTDPSTGEVSKGNSWGVYQRQISSTCAAT